MSAYQCLFLTKKMKPKPLRHNKFPWFCNKSSKSILRMKRSPLTRPRKSHRSSTGRRSGNRRFSPLAPLRIANDSLRKIPSQYRHRSERHGSARGYFRKAQESSTPNAGNRLARLSIGSPSSLEAPNRKRMICPARSLAGSPAFL